MTEEDALFTMPITESELLQLQVGDFFYEMDLGVKIKFRMTKHAEPNFPQDTGWVFEGEIVEVNGRESPDAGKLVDFFISYGAGFDYTHVTLNTKYYEGNNYGSQTP